MNTNYHGLQITVEKRMSHHFGVKGFYTFSKAITGATLENNTVNGGAEDFRNLALDRGRSDFDRRHVSVTSVIWDLSYFGKRNRFLNTVVNGWQLSGIITLQSGLPFNVTTGTDVNLDGNNNDRANLVGNPFLDPNRSRAAVTAAWFNTACVWGSSSRHGRQYATESADRTGKQERGPRARAHFQDTRAYKSPGAW